jgi:hypothetical protein
VACPRRTRQQRVNYTTIYKKCTDKLQRGTSGNHRMKLVCSLHVIFIANLTTFSITHTVPSVSRQYCQSHALGENCLVSSGRHVDGII